MRIKIPLIIIALALGSLFLWGVTAECADKTPESVREAAVTDVSIAMRLVKQAQDLINTKVTRDGMRAALGLYVQAGQLFEKSENVFRKLGSKYVPVEYVDKCVMYKNECITAINNLTKAIES